MAEQMFSRVLAIRHVNGVLAKTPWNNEFLVRLHEPKNYVYALHYGPPDQRKSLRDHPARVQPPPFLVCTTWENSSWTLVNATPDSFLDDEAIERPDNALVVHAWADSSADQTIVRIHARGEMTDEVVFQGVFESRPLKLVSKKLKKLRLGDLKYCETMHEAIALLFGQLGIQRRDPALVPENSHFRLICDPADVKAICIIGYAMPDSDF